MSIANKLSFIGNYANNKEQKTINLTKEKIPSDSIEKALNNADEGGDKLITHLLDVSKDNGNYRDVLREIALHNKVSINDDHSETIFQNHKDGIKMPYMAAQKFKFKPEHFDELSKSQDADLRSSVSFNPHLPKSSYDRLIKDPELRVRETASHSHHFKPEHVNLIYGENDPIEMSKNLLHKLNLHKGEKFKYDVGAVSGLFDIHSLTNEHAKKIMKYGTASGEEDGFYEIHPVTFEDSAKRGDDSISLYFKHHKASPYNMHRVHDIATSDYMKDKHVDNFLHSCRELNDYRKEEVLDSLKSNENLSKEKRAQLK